VDGSFNARRASYCLLLAHELPPPKMGGATQFADTRTAYEDLDDDVKEQLESHDYVVHHSFLHSRKLAAPEYYKDLEPEQHPMMRHRLVQRHERSGRMNLYAGAYAHHIEGLEQDGIGGVLGKMNAHAAKPEYVVEVEWRDVGDLVIWDNTCVMHRAVGGYFEGKYVRDMRRVTVRDASSQAWGLNERPE